MKIYKQRTATTETEREEDALPEPFYSFLDQMESETGYRIDVRKCSEADADTDSETEATWSVYVNGSLLCVTVDERGARLVKDALERLQTRIDEQRGKLGLLVQERDVLLR